MKTIEITNKFSQLTVAALLVVCILISNTQVNAADKSFDIAGIKVKLGLPPEYCLLDPNNPSDKNIITGTEKSIAGRNEVLSVFGKCSELEAWRSGKKKYLDYVGSYQIEISTKSVNYAGKEAEAIKAVCDYFIKHSPGNMKEANDKTEKAIQEIWNKIKLNETKLIGAFHRDQTSCIAVFLQKLQTEDKSEKKQVSLFSVGIINGRMISSFLFGPNKSGAITELVSSIKKLHKQNLVANKSAGKKTK